MIAASSIELEEFELVEAAPGTALLRIAARATLREAGGPSHLVIERAPERHRLSPLPAPPDGTGILRVAFSAPSAILAGAGFSLELPDGSLVSLPAPRRTRRIVQRNEAERRAEAPQEEPDEQEADAQAEQSELVALQETAAALAGQLDEAEARADALADVVRRQSADHEAVAEHLDSAEQARIQAEAAIAVLAAQVDRLAGRAAAGEALLARLRTEREAQLPEPHSPETRLSIEAVTGLILVALGVTVALLILTGVVHA